MKKILLAILCFADLSLSAQTSAFTYQGKLSVNGNAADGNYDLRFGLFDSDEFGFPVAPILTNSNVAVENGLFTAMLDFGPGVFTGTNYWLEIGVRTNGSSGVFTLLQPRQLITPAPYASHAASATSADTASTVSATGITGIIPNAQLSASVALLNGDANFSGAVSASSFTGSGASITSLNAANISSGAVSLARGGTGANLSGTGGTGQYLKQSTLGGSLTAGTIAVSDLPAHSHSAGEITIGTLTVARGGTGNSIVGSQGSVAYSTGTSYAFTGIGTAGQILKSTGGGTPAWSALNLANSAEVTGTLADSRLSTNVALLNVNQTYSGAVSLTNTANTFAGNGSSLSGLWKLGGNSGTFAGLHFLGTTDNQPLEFKVNGSTALRLENLAGGAPNVIGGSSINSVAAGVSGANIGGGHDNRIRASYSTIGGGAANEISMMAHGSTISGGQGNFIHTNSSNCTIGGGFSNVVETNASSSTVAGGGLNTIQKDSYISTIGGGLNNTIKTNASYSTIAGGGQHTIQTNAYNSTISGGGNNVVQSGAYNSTIAGGFNNTASGPYATIAGGDDNVAGTNSFAAGHRARATHKGSFVWADSAETDFATTAINQFLIRAANGVGINKNNPAATLDVNGTVKATTFSGSLAIGATASGNPIAVETSGTQSGGVPGFVEVTARFKRTGSGHSAIAVDAVTGQDSVLYLAENGSAKWGLRHDADDGGKFNLRFHGTGGNFAALSVTTNGNMTIAGALTQNSDRNLKTTFGAVNTREILDKVASLPISTWVYRHDIETRHIGPMAQDFYAAFEVGPDERHITTVDEGGVALAAIQGLNEVVKEKDARIRTLETRNGKLEERLAALERIVGALADKRQ